MHTETPKSSPTIKTVQLSRWYGEVIAITDISLQISPGVTGLLGPNGAGKSTLMKVLTGQLKPSNGAALLFDQPIWNNGAVLARIGFCPEYDSFYENMSALRFVTYLLKLHGFLTKDAEKIAADTLGIVNLSERKNDPIRTFSKGMRQRVKLAQAIAHDPDILFLDEPLTGTDPVGRRHIIDLIRELGTQGKTILVSSHILHEVEAMTSEILLINKGRVIADGDVSSIQSMIDAHTHQIAIACDDPRALAALLATFKDVTHIHFTPDGLRVGTEDPPTFYNRIPDLVLDHNMAIQSLSSPDNSLAAVFRSLTKRGYKQTSGV